jgi:CelD/BcsL family acetyltransferase involved in cellulose biosynthesis
MDIAFGYPLVPDETLPALPRCAADIARIEIFDELPAAEPFWRRLENGPALLTPYQRFDLLAAWQRHVGAPAGITPFIVTGFDRSGEPLFLWPFGRTRKCGLSIACFLGFKHANFNLGLWRRDLAAQVTAADLHHIFDRAARGIDLALLCNQPLSWDGIANPFGLLPRRESVDTSARHNLIGASGARRPAISKSMRSRLHAKERKLLTLPGYRYLQARTTAEIDRLLDSFFALKSRHMTLRGLADVFAEPGIAEFLRQGCHCKLANGRPLIEIHALEINGEVLALFGVTVDDYRFSSMFSTYTLGEHGRRSPGLILLTHMVDECAARGIASLDLGVGQARYKSFFCREPEPLFDSFLPFTLRGRLAASGFAAGFAAKRAIKRNSALWSAVKTLRRARARRTAAAD